jgi:hypothetical protein
MAITARSGPAINFGVTTYGSTDGITGNSADYNDQRGPSLSDLGAGLLDPRAAFNYANGAVVTQPVYGLYGGVGLIDVVPTAKSSIAIVAAITASSSLASTSLTLQAASTGRGTVATTFVAPESGATLTSVLTLGSSTDVRTDAFGVSSVVNTWSPTFVARAVSVELSSYTDSPWTIHGRDQYGYKVSAAVSMSSNGSYESSYGGTTLQTFRYIDAVYTSSTPSSSGIVGVGTADIYGFPLYVPYFGQNVAISVSSAAGVSNAIISLISTTNARLGSTLTATSTTPDVRGTFVSSVASANSYRIQIKVTPSASALAAVTSTNVSPLFGLTQYSS